MARDVSAMDWAITAHWRAGNAERTRARHARAGEIVSEWMGTENR